MAFSPGPRSPKFEAVPNFTTEVETFDDLRALLKDAGFHEIADISWSHVVNVSTLCGYNNAKEFLSDCATLGKDSFLFCLPQTILPPPRAAMARFFEALTAMNILQSPCSHAISNTEGPDHSVEQKELFGRIQRMVLEILQVRPSRRLSGKARWISGRWTVLSTVSSTGASKRARDPTSPSPGRLPGARSVLTRRAARQAKTKSKAEAALREASRGHYDVLQIPRSATTAEIRAAYRLRARETHPDKVGSPSSEAFLAVTESFGVLSDDERRKAYDSQLRTTGSEDGLVTQDVRKHVSELAETEDKDRALMWEARRFYLRLAKRPAKSWNQDVSALDDAALSKLLAWMESYLFTNTSSSSSAAYEETTSGVQGISSRSNELQVELVCGFHELNAVCRGHESVLAIDRYAALARIKEAWRARTSTRSDKMITEDDIAQGLESEPTMRPGIRISVTVSKKRIVSPESKHFSRAEPYFRELLLATRSETGARRVEGILRKMRLEFPKIEAEMIIRDQKVYRLLHNERLARASRALGTNHPMAEEPWTPRIAALMDMPNKRVRYVFSQLEALPAEERQKRLNWLLHGTTVQDDPLDSIATVTFILGLPTDTAKTLLSCLQLHSLCKLQAASKSCSMLVRDETKARTEHFVFTTEGLQGEASSKRGRRISLPCNLVPFLSSPRNIPLFRSLDLRNAPVSSLQHPAVMRALPQMQNLSRILLPKKGWADRKALSDFLHAIPDRAGQPPTSQG